MEMLKVGNIFYFAQNILFDFAPVDLQEIIVNSEPKERYYLYRVRVLFIFPAHAPQFRMH